MKNLVVLTGAGMSAESGISTFRDSGGLWDRYPVEQVATPEGYAANPKLVIDFIMNAEGNCWKWNQTGAMSSWQSWNVILK